MAKPPSGDSGDNVTPIFDLLMSPYHSSVLVIFGRLGLFDYIHQQGSQGVAVQELATKAEWSVRATSAMLISLVSSGILTTVPSSSTDTVHSFEHRYQLTARASRFLRSDQPGNVNGYFELFWEVSPDKLLEKASADKHQENFMLETGGEGGAPSDMFIAAMQGQSSHAAMVLSPLLDLSGTTHFVDVGGGSGTVCIEACKANPTMQGSIYELPGVCPIAEKYIAEAGLTDRVKAVPGNMFNDPTFPAADLYHFGNVFHDWSDDTNKALLEKAYKSLSGKGKVVLLEMLVAEDVTSTTQAAAGLNLVMVTNEDGRQYKASEFENVLKEVGFADVQVISSPLTPYSAIVASKK